MADVFCLVCGLCTVSRWVAAGLCRGIVGAM